MDRQVGSIGGYRGSGILNGIIYIILEVHVNSNWNAGHFTLFWIILSHHLHTRPKQKKNKISQHMSAYGRIQTIGVYRYGFP